MTKTEQRRIALGAARSQLRHLKIDIQNTSCSDALMVLDDLHRSQPDLIASIWYSQATDHQIKLFKREWQKQFMQRVLPISTSDLERPIILRQTYQLVG